MNSVENDMKVYRLSNEEVEKLLAAKYGKTLMAVDPSKLARKKQWQANQLKKSR